MMNFETIQKQQTLTIHGHLRLKPVSAQVRPIRLTLRDLDIFQAVYERRVLTSRQLFQLFFSKTFVPDAPVHGRCKTRLRQLFKHGYLDRREQKCLPSEGRAPYLYYLGPDGARLLSEHLGTGLRWHPHDNALEDSPELQHLLMSNDVWLRTVLATQAHEDIEIVESYHDQKFKRPFSRSVDYVRIQDPRGNLIRAPVTDDGYLKLRFRGRPFPYYRFFIEVDRGTETIHSRSWLRTSWRKKVYAYNEYIASGACEERYGSARVRILRPTSSFNPHRRQLDTGMRKVTFSSSCAWLPPLL